MIGLIGLSGYLVQVQRPKSSTPGRRFQVSKPKSSPVSFLRIQNANPQVPRPKSTPGRWFQSLQVDSQVSKPKSTPGRRFPSLQAEVYSRASIPKSSSRNLLQDVDSKVSFSKNPERQDVDSKSPSRFPSLLSRTPTPRSKAEIYSRTLIPKSPSRFQSLSGFQAEIYSKVSTSKSLDQDPQKKNVSN